MHVSLPPATRVRLGWLLRTYFDRAGFLDHRDRTALRAVAVALGARPTLVRAWVDGHVVPTAYWITRMWRVLALTPEEVVAIVAASAQVEHARNVARERDRPHPLDPPGQRS